MTNMIGTLAIEVHYDEDRKGFMATLSIAQPGTARAAALQAFSTDKVTACQHVLRELCDQTLDQIEAAPE